FCSDFFFRFYEIVVNEKTLFADININRFLSLSFGYSYDNETLDAINGALNNGLSGHLPFFSKGNFSAGAIISPPSNVGAYIEHSKNIVGNFYGFIDLGVEIDITKLFQNPDLEISTEIAVASAIGVSSLLLFWLIEALGSAVASPLVPVL
ncbi:MAG: hypothetical protein K2J35_00085, partial [Eubacterium sp.]|nr:hypothetical protein [Eubacterium sp.]